MSFCVVRLLLKLPVLLDRRGIQVSHTLLWDGVLCFGGYWHLAFVVKRLLKVAFHSLVLTTVDCLSMQLLTVGSGNT